MENRKIDVDALLKKALNNNESPDQMLLQKLKYDLLKEETILNKNIFKYSLRTAIISVLSFIFITTSVFAAWYFLSPAEIAEKFEQTALAEAFRSDNAILINKTQSKNNYDVSLLGIVSGKGLTEFDETINIEKSYAIVAISKQDGEMPKVSDDSFDEVPFFISPLIKGQKPWLYNIASMNGGYSTCIIDGVMYRLIECDNIEIFSDRGLKLIVSSTSFYDINAFDYDESTGIVTPNPNFDGVNLVFDLPLDTSKADFIKAQKYLDSLWDEKDDIEENSNDDMNSEVEFFDINEYNEAGLGTSRVMNYEGYKKWTELKLKETQKLVDKGEYSVGSMNLDQQDYESNLKEIENGATLTMIEFTNGDYRVMITYPETGFEATLDDCKNVVIYQ